MLRVVPDATWPGMWRIETSDGRLSDMANWTRIRDAAMSIALAELNLVVKETARGAPPTRQNRPDGPEVGPAGETPTGDAAGSLLDKRAKFDKRSYQREYMRRRRVARQEAAA
jgi:hypothetical protein